jgi:hypothetical protein
MRNNREGKLRSLIDGVQAMASRPTKSTSTGAGLEKVSIQLADANYTADTLFPGNTTSNLTLILTGSTTATRTVTLPAAPFLGERFTVAVDGSGITYAIDFGGPATISMSGQGAVTPQTALRNSIGGGHFSSATVIWTGISWVQVSSVLVASTPIP